ncbi:hypothetical protein [Hamadaea tsunoensis]|uniref:hypothetical protein n=1 Tax=Hamadaea tsunoensis TaxID=53368 RepID=UPI0003FEF830|nr:hypothetical protein [Hamadaea tsunoensis]
MNIRFVAAAGAVGVLLAVSGQVPAAQAATIPVDLRAVEAQVTGSVGETVPLLLHFSSSAPSAGVHVKIAFPPGTTVTPAAIFQPRCKGPATGPLDCAYTTLQQGDHTLTLRLRITSAQVGPGGFALRFEPGTAPGAATYVDPDTSNNAAAIRVTVPGASASPSAAVSASPSRRPSPSPSPSTESPSPEASPTADLPTEAAGADATSADALPTAGTNAPDKSVSLLSVVIIGGSIVLVIVGVLLMWLLLRRPDDDDDEGEDFLDTRFGGR